MLKDAKFVEGGEIAVSWYPNFSMNLSGGVNFAQIMTGRLTITAAAGKDTADFVQFVLNVAIGLPKFIPIVGGIELASAELGGGSEKVWGSVEVLSLIKVGFTYYWGGDIEFTHGNPSGSQNFATLMSTDDAGERRTKLMYNRMLEPTEVGTDSKTGETQFASVGGNLSYSAGSRAVADFEERVKRANGISNSGIRLMAETNSETEVFTNTERTSHLVNFGENCDYILSVSRADGSEISADELKKHMSVTKGGAAYELRYYSAPDRNASDNVKKNALKNANVNISQNAAYIAIPKAGASNSLLIEFSDGNSYDVSAIKVNPISTLTSYNAAVNGNNLHVEWNGENISDSAKIIIRATDGNDENGIILNAKEISAKALSADVAIPDRLSSGEYSILVTLTDENTTYQSYNAGTVTIVNPKAPAAANDVTIENCGDDKLKINVATSKGDWYEFTDKKTEISQKVALPDGDYTGEFHAADDDGDHVIVSQIISIDTTAPVIMLASPMSGDRFGGDSITVMATADRDAAYSFKIDGNTVYPQDLRGKQCFVQRFRWRK